MSACWRGDLDEVISQIETGADVNAGNINGTTPLMYAKTFAFSTGDMRIIDMLLAHGADPNIRDRHGKTAADYTRERCELIISALTGQAQINRKL